MRSHAGVAPRRVSGRERRARRHGAGQGGLSRRGRRVDEPAAGDYQGRSRAHLLRDVRFHPGSAGRRSDGEAVTESRASGNEVVECEDEGTTGGVESASGSTANGRQPSVKSDSRGGQVFCGGDAGTMAALRAQVDADRPYVQSALADRWVTIAGVTFPDAHARHHGLPTLTAPMSSQRPIPRALPLRQSGFEVHRPGERMHLVSQEDGRERGHHRRGSDHIRGPTRCRPDSDLRPSSGGAGDVRRWRHLRRSRPGAPGGTVLPRLGVCDHRQFR